MTTADLSTQGVNVARHRFRFSLRTLLLTVLAVGAFFAWWTRPFAVQEDWGQFSGLTMRYKIRRNWDGRRYYVGTATLTYENGQMAAEAHLDGIEQNTITLWIGDERHEYWRADGTMVSWQEWFQYVALDYLMKRNPPTGSEQF